MSLLNRIGLNKIKKETINRVHYPVHKEYILNAISNYLSYEGFNKKTILKENKGKYTIKSKIKK